VLFAVNRADVAARAEPLWHRFALADASLWWVSAEMCELLLAAERTLPDDTIAEAELLPREQGLVVFERSMPATDAERPERPIAVDAMCWAPIMLGRRNRRAIGMASYRHLNADDGMGPEDLNLAISSGAIDMALADGWVHEESLSAALHGDIWAPLGRGDWPFGTSVDDVPLIDDSSGEPLQFTAAQMASITEDRRRLATLWLLLSQPGIVQAREERAPRGEQRRAQRAGTSAPHVQIIDIARAHSPSSSTSAADEHERRHLHVRFVVSGHWRRQAYGPARAYRRPTWIAAHWRGPEDAPLSNVEHVRVFRQHDEPAEGER
jgi:hypothetical protein